MELGAAKVATTRTTSLSLRVVLQKLVDDATERMIVYDPWKIGIKFFSIFNTHGFGLSCSANTWLQFFGVSRYFIFGNSAAFLDANSCIGGKTVGLGHERSSRALQGPRIAEGVRVRERKWGWRGGLWAGGGTDSWVIFQAWLELTKCYWRTQSPQHCLL